MSYRSVYSEQRSKRLDKAKWMVFPPTILALSGANAWMQYNLFPGQSQVILGVPIVLALLSCVLTYQSGSKGDRAANSAYAMESLSIIVMIVSLAFTYDSQRQISSARERAGEVAKGAEKNQSYKEHQDASAVERLKLFDNCLNRHSKLPKKMRVTTNVTKMCGEPPSLFSADGEKLTVDATAGYADLRVITDHSNRYFMVFSLSELICIFLGIILTFFFEKKVVRRRRMPNRSFERTITTRPGGESPSRSDLIQ